MSAYDAEIGARIREAREAADLTLDDVAASLGCTRSAAGHYEAGRRGLKADQIVRFAAAVKADPCWLLVGPTSPVQANAHRIRAAAGALATVAGVLDDLLRGQS